MYKQVALLPRIMSEKAYGLSQTKRTYVFDIPKGTTKQSIAGAIAAQFDVTVTNVNIANKPGKAKRSMTKRKQYRGRDVAVRKAYVTVAEGQIIPIYAAAEEAEAKQEAVQEKIAKAIAKKSVKEAKETKPAADKETKSEAKPARKGLLGRKKATKEDK